jgi:hypothetical protein
MYRLLQCNMTKQKHIYRQTDVAIPSSSLNIDLYIYAASITSVSSLSMALQPFAPCPYLVGRAPWMGDHPTEQTHTDIHASSGFRTNDLNVRAGEESSCLFFYSVGWDLTPLGPFAGPLGSYKSQYCGHTLAYCIFSPDDI